MSSANPSSRRNFSEHPNLRKTSKDNNKDNKYIVKPLITRNNISCLTHQNTCPVSIVQINRSLIQISTQKSTFLTVG